MTDMNAEAVAVRLVDARIAATALGDYPGAVPGSLAAACAVQEAAIARYGDAVVGWKVGMIKPALQAELGAHRLAGPIFARKLWRAEDTPTPLPIIPGGFAAVEAEFVARLGDDADPDKTDWTLDEAAVLIGGVSMGVELAGSPLATISDLGPAVVVSDFGNNLGLLLGPELADWRRDLFALEVETTVDGVRAGVGTGDSLPLGPLESVRFLLEHCARRGRPLRRDALVSTGAVTGVHRVGMDSEIVARFGAFGEVRGVVVEAVREAAPPSGRNRS